MAHRPLKAKTPHERLQSTTALPRGGPGKCIAHAIRWLWIAVLLCPAHFATAGALPPEQFELPDIYRQNWPADEVLEAQLLHDLGPDYKALRGSHFLIVHSHRSLTVPYRAAIIESVYASFVHFFNQRGFKLMRPASLQTVILLPTHQEFVAHAGIPDLAENVDGLYLPEENRAYFFDALGRIETREIDQANQKKEVELKQLRGKIARSRDNSEWTLKRKGSPGRRYTKRKAIEEIDRQLRLHKRDSRRLRSSVGQRSVETMCHEIVHQLAQVMRVFPPSGQSPRWITEGLATFFEPSKDGFLLTHGATHWARWDALQRSHRGGERIILRDLLTRDALLVDPSAAALAYNESWSLVHYLVNKRGDGFTRYLRALKTPGASESTDRRLRTFEEAFGDKLAQIESDWGAHVASLGTPEAHLPAEGIQGTQAPRTVTTKRSSVSDPMLADGEANPRE